MKILITGATGLVGRALTLRLQRDGHQVVAWVRNPVAAAGTLGAQVELLPTDEGDAGLARAMEQVDAVVNLAGAPVAKRWTANHRQAMRSSRVGVTQRLVDAMASASSKPRVLVSGSAVGWYGDRGDEVLDEDSAPGEGYLAQLCREWEGAAEGAREHGVRLCTLRIGVVLDGEGGALATMRPSFAAGLGAAIGSGRQFMPLIHLRDLVELVVQALTDERYEGAINAVSPCAVSNRDFSKALARALGRPMLLKVPGFALRLALGDAAAIVLASQRVVPRRLEELGFSFRFSQLDAMLADAVDRGHAHVQIGPAVDVPQSDYLSRRRPRYLLEQRTLIGAPLAEVFELFCRAENLGVMTPSGLGFEIQTPGKLDMAAGTQIAYQIRLGPVPMGWLTNIEVWEQGQRFVDAQLRGPYRCWYHEHRFEADGDRTLMVDRVWYAPPLGLLGRVANWMFVAKTLRRIFGYRRRAIDLRFGVVG
ncbi:MAG: TIGR01777 family oxidoreductase [Myxococcota bacterium]